jgi:hypothetical protein
MESHYHQSVLERNTKQRLHHLVNCGLNGRMKKAEIRRARLRQLVDELSNGNITRFGELIDRSQSHVSDLLHGRKSFGEKAARDIERRLKLDEGWLDRTVDAGMVITAPDELEWISLLRELTPEQKAIIRAVIGQMPVERRLKSEPDHDEHRSPAPRRAQHAVYGPVNTKLEGPAIHEKLDALAREEDERLRIKKTKDQNISNSAAPSAKKGGL